jgi:hypothetical protein
MAAGIPLGQCEKGVARGGSVLRVARCMHRMSGNADVLLTNHLSREGMTPGGQCRMNVQSPLQ